jgi:predicted ABC-type ATPase
MSHPSKIDILVRAKEAGFFVQLFFVGTDDPQTNVKRVALRVQQGGHSVPTDKIVSRWTRTMGLLHRAITASDQAFVFDNSAAGNASTGPRLIFRRNISQEWAAPQIEQRPPIPGWVRKFVLDALDIAI